MRTGTDAHVATTARTFRTVTRTRYCLATSDVHGDAAYTGWQAPENSSGAVTCCGDEAGQACVNWQVGCRRSGAGQGFGSCQGGAPVSVCEAPLRLPRCATGVWRRTPSASRFCLALPTCWWPAGMPRPDEARVCPKAGRTRQSDETNSFSACRAAPATKLLRQPPDYRHSRCLFRGSLGTRGCE